MDRTLHDALSSGRRLEEQLTRVAADTRLSPADRSAKVQALIREATATPLADVWAAAGRPEPLGFTYNARADHAEWFDAWLEVESVVLDGEARGYSRDELEAMILRNEEPFDLEFEAEDLGIIHRRNESAHTD